MGVVELGIMAAALQAAGYLVYGSRVLRRDILPNPTSWLMFAYGTTLLLILEWDRDASFALLALPAVCAMMSIGVAFYCLRHVGRGWWPEHPLERFSFMFDVFLTISYLTVWILLIRGFIGEELKDLADIVILACWNVGVFTSFFPLLRQVYRHPMTEHVLPWVIWTVAYVILTYVTVVEQRGMDELFLYPMINVLIHGFITLRIGVWHLMRSRPAF